MHQTRASKRASRACNNCRRKKTKCPEERPRCSNCLRLQQECHYSGVDAAVEHDGGLSMDYLEQRLSQIEEKLENIAGPPPLQTLPFPDSELIIADGSLSLPALSGTRRRGLVNEMIELYFEYCHRQPIWLFDPSLAFDVIYESPEILLPICALALLCAPRLQQQRCVRQAISYSNVARRVMMLKVADGNVSLRTLQGLCLLSFYNYAVLDLSLARLHLGIVQNLLRESNLDRRYGDMNNSDSEERSSLFWSVQLLDHLLGYPPRSICVTSDARNPFYFTRNGVPRPLTLQCPLLPKESCPNGDQRDQGIWAMLIQMTAVWQQVRSYMAECAEGRNTSPWSPESAYTEICSALNESECLLPSCHRYVNSRFSEQTREEIDARKAYWLVWIEVQIAYHTIHATLNHPFLYAQEGSKHKRGPNMFWKTSSELALLHSTWIAKLIHMAADRKLRIHDPHLARCAAIAATIHFYYSKTADPSISVGASANLEKCRACVRQLAPLWPMCEQINVALDKLIDRATAIDGTITDGSSQVVLSTSLMWDILGYTIPVTSHFGKRLFDNSFSKDDTAPQQHRDTAVARPSYSKNPDVLCAQERNVASSPSWFSAASSPSPSLIEERSRMECTQKTQEEAAQEGQVESPPLANTVESGEMYDNTMMDLHYSIFTQPFDLDGSDLDRWDFGTL